MRSNPQPSVRIPATPADVADSGKVRTGMGFKKSPPTKAPASVTDTGKVRSGMGFKVFAVARAG